MDLLVELLIALALWLFRLLTKQQKNDEAELPGPQGSSVPSPGFPSPATGQSTASLRQAGTALQQGVAALRSVAEGVPERGAMVEGLDRDLSAPLQRYLETMPPHADARTMLFGQRQLDTFAARFAAYQALVEGRAARDPIRLFASTAPLIDALYRPLLDHGRSFSAPQASRVPVPAIGVDVALGAAFAHSSFAPIAVPESFRDDALWGFQVAEALGRDLFFSTPGLEDELRGRLLLPRAPVGPVPGQVQVVMSPRSARVILAQQLPELFAVMVATTVLGPAFLEGFLARVDLEARSRVGGLDASVSVRLSCAVLHHLGLHREADSLLEEGKKRWFGEGALLTPGLWVPAGVLEAVTAELAEGLLTTRFEALGRFRLEEIPGFAYLHAEDASAKRVQARLSVGGMPDEDPRSLLAGAMLASAQSPALVGRIAARLHDSLRPEHQLPEEASPGGASDPLRTLPLGAALRRAARDRTMVQEAVVLGAALTTC